MDFWQRVANPIRTPEDAKGSAFRFAPAPQSAFSSSAASAGLSATSVEARSEIHRRPKWRRCTTHGPTSRELAIGQVIELFSLVKLFQDFRSARWVTGQHAGGEIECLTGSLDQSLFKMMDVSCHKSGDTLRGYVRDADAFRDHAEAGLL